MKKVNREFFKEKGDEFIASLGKFYVKFNPENLEIISKEDLGMIEEKQNEEVKSVYRVLEHGFYKILEDKYSITIIKDDNKVVNMIFSDLEENDEIENLIEQEIIEGWKAK
ncbi:MAG: hypothetical protein ACRC0Y_14775 [Fusobacteriaceae bacterium]